MLVTKPGIVGSSPTMTVFSLVIPVLDTGICVSEMLVPNKFVVQRHSELVSESLHYIIVQMLNQVQHDNTF